MIFTVILWVIAFGIFVGIIKKTVFDIIKFITKNKNAKNK